MLSRIRENAYLGRSSPKPLDSMKRDIMNSHNVHPTLNITTTKITLKNPLKKFSSIKFFVNRYTKKIT